MDQDECFTKGKHDLLICPYDKVHVVREKRMPYHLIKCRENWRRNGGAEMVSCPYNATHHVPAPELSMHMKTCQFRDYAERSLFAQGDEGRFGQWTESSRGTSMCGGSQTGAASSTYPEVHQSSYAPEDWDAQASDDRRPAYNPRHVLLTKAARGEFFIPDVSLMKPAERKEIYKALQAAQDRKEALMHAQQPN